MVTQRRQKIKKTIIINLIVKNVIVSSTAIANLTTLKVWATSNLLKKEQEQAKPYAVQFQLQTKQQTTLPLEAI